ncbi:MAG: hypothetical protein OEY56_12945, partial [Cyclobacteriaceae bacterium]|nr:hypothetical protein [Cyclobacteriaceae bacterium]
RRPILRTNSPRSKRQWSGWCWPFRIGATRHPLYLSWPIRQPSPTERMPLLPGLGGGRRALCHLSIKKSLKSSRLSNGSARSVSTAPVGGITGEEWLPTAA